MVKIKFFFWAKEPDPYDREGTLTVEPEGVSNTDSKSTQDAAFTWVDSYFVPVENDEITHGNCVYRVEQRRWINQQLVHVIVS